MRRTLVMTIFAFACSSRSGGSNPDAALPGDAAPTDAATDGAPPDGAVTGVALADLVIDAPGASGTGNGNPELAVNGVRGAGSSSGSTDVYSMGYGSNNYITLAWSGGNLANGSGADFAVFENAFDYSGGVFMDLIVVEVSRDGSNWRDIPHQYVTSDETVYVADPAAWQGFAGKTPVFYNVDTNPVDPFGSATGGDAFDLDDIDGSDAESIAIRTDGIRYVKLVTAPSLVDPDTGSNYVHDPLANGADIDGMFGRYVGE